MDFGIGSVASSSLTELYQNKLQMFRSPSGARKDSRHPCATCTYAQGEIRGLIDYCYQFLDDLFV